MIGLGRKKQATAPTALSSRAYNAMAVMLLLSQLPHIFHLPIWVSAFGIGVVVMKWRSIHSASTNKFNWLLSSRASIFWALLGGILIRLHYGYFLGRDPCVAFLFLLVGCKYAETRRQSDATTLMCLSGFLLLTQYFYSQTILSAVLTIPAVIALGTALSMLTEHTQRTAKTHAKLVGKLLIQGAPIAALLFVLFPRLPGPLWSLPDDAAATTGLSDNMSPGDISNLSRSDEVAFRVEFDGTPPAARDLYWRGPVMSNFDGRNWTINDLQEDYRIVENDAASKSDTALSYTVTLQPHYKTWLFALEQASTLPSTGETDKSKSSFKPTMRSDNQIVSNTPITKLIQYKQSSLLFDRYTPAKPPGPLDSYLPGKNPRAAAFASELYREHNSPQRYAQAVLNWFNTQPYRYTLQPNLLGDSPIDEFLFDTQNGFCGHYASAFVVMMRAVGIPARIVTGYLGGEMNGDYMIVRQSEAHAWVEAYMDGQWVRFDPTAAVAPSRVELGLAEALPDYEPVPMLAKMGNGWMKRASLRWDRVNHGWQRMVIDFNNESQSNFWKNLGMPDPELWQITVALLLMASLWCLWVLRPTRSSLAHLSEDEKHWHSYCQYLDDAGVVRLSGETGSQLTARARTQLSEHNELLARLGLAFSKIRFEPTSSERKQIIRTQLKRDLKKLASIARRSKTNRFTKHALQSEASATS